MAQPGWLDIPAFMAAVVGWVGLTLSPGPSPYSGRGE